MWAAIALEGRSHRERQGATKKGPGQFVNRPGPFFSLSAICSGTRAVVPDKYPQYKSS